MPRRTGDPHPNRLFELRSMQHLTQQELGERAGLGHHVISKLERGKLRLTAEYQTRLAAALDVAPGDLLAGSTGVSIPVTLAVAAHESERRPDLWDMEEPFERIAPPRRLERPDLCFAVEICDDSADRLYPPGSLLICREALPAEKLAVGAKVVVRRFVADRADGRTLEVLAGLLDVAVTGELVLLLQSSSRLLPSSVPIRAAPAGRRQFSERTLTLLPRPSSVSYEPADEDAGEILGRIVWALTPEG